MCLTLPVEVVEVDGAWATVETSLGRRRASTLVLPDVQPGDWAILAAGTLIEILDPQAAHEITAAVNAATGADDAGGMPR